VTLLALGMSIAPHAAAQPSPDVGPFYAFGGFALFGPDSNDQLRGERGGAGLNVGGGFRFSRLLSFELGVLGAGYRPRAQRRPRERSRTELSERTWAPED
jgi:hypothetical protein